MASARDRYHHGHLREAALTAADTVLDRAGPEALTLRELAGALGVSHRALYRHFADRDALLGEVAVRTMRALQESMRSAAEASSAQRARARLEAAIDAYVLFAFRRPLAYGHAMRTGVARSEAPRRCARRPEPSDATSASCTSRRWKRRWRALRRSTLSCASATPWPCGARFTV